MTGHKGEKILLVTAYHVKSTDNEANESTGGVICIQAKLILPHSAVGIVCVTGKKTRRPQAQRNAALKGALVTMRIGMHHFLIIDALLIVGLSAIGCF